MDAGTPAAIFISADHKWMQYLTVRQRIAASASHDLLGNALVLIAPKGQAFKVRFEPDFKPASAFDGRLCTGDPDVVPAGIYAKEALVHLGWWPALRGRIVGTAAVRAQLAFVERLECEAGIGDSSDATISTTHETAGTFPDTTHTNTEN